MGPYHVLIVDDDKTIQETTSGLLRACGYRVTVANDGFDALLQLKTPPPPHLVISDLNMPHMSGFEFLSVLRRRFPEIAVVASSGEYQSASVVPGGIIADAFHAKGSHPAELLTTVADLLAMSEDSIIERHTASAPVWIPLNGRDSHGDPFIVVTCPDCLRSFPLSAAQENCQEIQEAECPFCPTRVRYIIDFTLNVASPKPPQRVTNTPNHVSSEPGMFPSALTDDRELAYRFVRQTKTAAFSE